MSVREKKSFGSRLVTVAAFVLFSPVLVPLIVLALVAHFLNLAALYLLVWFCWLPKGKDILYVSSDSPVWRGYMQNEILPLVAGRAIVLNWSERHSWSRLSLHARVFRAFGGWRNYNPMVVLFRPLRRAKVFRFRLAFKDWKHGHPEDLERLRRDLTRAL
jgi:hypothetical protein